MTMEISRQTVEVLESRFEDVRTDYSGRGMYGSECFGIVSDGSGWTLAQSLSEMLADAREAEYYDLEADLETLLEREPTTDSMAFDTIFYWPNVRVSEED
jgi:hypothetical protein